MSQFLIPLYDILMNAEVSFLANYLTKVLIVLLSQSPCREGSDDVVDDDGDDDKDDKDIDEDESDNES